LATGELQVSGVLHDIQYQGSATRYELKLDNGQTLSVSQANNQWQDASGQRQVGQRLQVSWPRQAMTLLQDAITPGEGL
jgi:putative spermidine/putrescine transport system ATP-binding protein